MDLTDLSLQVPRCRYQVKEYLTLDKRNQGSWSASRPCRFHQPYECYRWRDFPHGWWPFFIWSENQTHPRTSPREPQVSRTIPKRQSHAGGNTQRRRYNSKLDMCFLSPLSVYIKQTKSPTSLTDLYFSNQRDLYLGSSSLSSQQLVVITLNNPHIYFRYYKILLWLIVDW